MDKKNASFSKINFDKILEKVHLNTLPFAKLSIKERIALLDDIMERFKRIAEPFIKESCLNKGIDYESDLSAEEWITIFLPIVRFLRLLRKSLYQIDKGKNPSLPSITTLPNGRTVVKVFPQNFYDHMLAPDLTAELDMKKDVTPENIHEHFVKEFQKPQNKGEITLVLGAGNINSIPINDSLMKLFVERSCVILLCNPVNSYITKYAEQIFEKLIDKGYFAVVNGGLDAGSYLIHHQLVNRVHITGKVTSHDSIVWGATEEERKRRKEKNTPLLQKPITSELGNITPVIVVPGEWTKEELDFQAEMVASMVTVNGGYNCITAKVLLMAKEWKYREKFIDLLTKKLAATPLRKCIFPPILKEHEKIVSTYKSDRIKLIGSPRDGELPWTLIEVESSEKNNYFFKHEAFGPFLFLTTLDEPDPARFLHLATEFCNDTLWGTLGASILITPATKKLPEVEKSLCFAIENLRYGTVAINQWTAISYSMMTTPWGSYPGNTLSDIQSGMGWVHDVLLLRDIEKVVLKGPIIAKPKPIFFRSSPDKRKIAIAMINLSKAKEYQRPFYLLLILAITIKSIVINAFKKPTA